MPVAVDFARRTIDLAMQNVEEGGRPFACVIARDGDVIAESPNLVAQTQDPTAHAEIVAIRRACTELGTEHLTGCDIYVLAHPCPMCLGSLYYCSPDRVVFITTREEYSRYYTDDRRYFELETLYAEVCKPWQERRLPMEYRPVPSGIEVYARWRELKGT
jgi:tRNA(Arg) A34 adenosine deaminase TadA